MPSQKFVIQKVKGMPRETTFSFPGRRGAEGMAKQAMLARLCTGNVRFHQVAF